MTNSDESLARVGGNSPHVSEVHTCPRQAACKIGRPVGSCAGWRLL